MINLPNILTLSRIPVLFIVVGLIHIDFAYAATLSFWLYVIGALTDIIDGWIARKYNIVSNFGKLIDALMDKVFVIGFFITLLAVQFLPSWGLLCVLIIVAREFVITGLRLVAASRGLVLAAERLGKLKTFTQIFSIGTYLFYHMITMDFSVYLQYWMLFFVQLVGAFTLILATMLTLLSGLNYLWKYWSILIQEDN